MADANRQGAGDSPGARAEVHESASGESDPTHKKPVAKAVRRTNADCVRALELAGYDYTIAALALGMDVSSLRQRVKGMSDSEKSFTLVEPDTPTRISTIVREREDHIPTPVEKSLGEQIIRQNRQILRDGLTQAGIKPETIEKLKAFDGFATSAGDFLLASLDLSHRSMVYLMVTLLEMADQIKKDYLAPATTEGGRIIDEETRLGWQEAYTDIVDQVGRCYDRTLVGTQAMARMLGTDKENKKGKKPSFKALQRVEKVANGKAASKPV